jgi:hypothetical protein
MNKAQKIIGIVLSILMMGSLLAALSSSAGIRNDPKAPDPGTGHTIPLSVRGAGTVYLDQAEWTAIAPYWNTFYVFLGLFLAFILGCFLHEAYQGFMRGWRADK